MSMKGFVLEPTQILINGLEFKENIYVAPLEDAMLLGLDFMSKHKVMVDIKGSQLLIQDQVIPFI